MSDDECEYTFEHLEAAACMWEYVLRQLRKDGPWLDYAVAYSLKALREIVIRHAPVLQAEYEEARANKYSKTFDEDFVPKYMADHVARILT